MKELRFDRKSQSDRVSDFSGAMLEKADMSNSKFNDACFNGAILTDANLEGAILTNCDFADANLENANLKNAKVEGASFENANLAKVDLRNANFTKELISNAILSPSILNKSKNQDVLEMLQQHQEWWQSGGKRGRLANIVGLDLRHFKSQLRGMRLTGINAKDSCAIGVVFAEAQLQGANFSNADLRGAVFVLSLIHI